MSRFVSVILLTGLYGTAYCQVTPGTTNVSSPEERGLIITTLDRNDSQYARVRHLPIYPGYESFRGEIPGIKITSSGNTHVLDIDVDFRNKTFFMYDYYLRSILFGSGYHKELNVEALNVTLMHIGVSKGTVQLAVDWLSHVVYWTDSVFRWIAAAPGQEDKLEKDYYTIIINTHLDAPDGIALDPINGYLFWSDNGIHPKIERSDLMGNNRHTLVTQHLVSPLSMETDIAARRIYWIDSYTEAILSSSYDGELTSMVTRVPSSTLFDVALFRDVVYVSDIRNGNVYTLNKTTGQQKSTALNISPETIYGIAVYGEEIQPLKVKDYCKDNACEHICISEENGAKCVCSEGYEMDKTTGQCQESYLDFRRAIVIANSTHVCMLDIRSFAIVAYDLVCRFTIVPSSSTTTTAPPIPTTAGRSMTAFDIDVENRVLFFSTDDNNKTTIYKRPIDSIEDSATDQILETAGKVSGLAYDTVYSKNLYWCESETGHVWMVNVDTEIPRRIVPEDNIKNPNSIVVLPKPRKLAWITRTVGDMSIQTMNMDGTNFDTVVSGYADIAALAFDNEAQVLYFASRRNSRIYSATLDGATATVVEDNTIRYLFDILHYNKYLAWTYRGRNGNVMKTKDFGLDRTVAHGELGHTSPIIGMKVLDTKPRLPEADSPCAYNNGGCSQICITKYKADIMSKVCECRLGFTLGPDKISCKSEVVKANFILVSDWTNSVIQQIDLKTHAINAVFNREGYIYMGVYFDTNTNRIIWSEYKKSLIFSSNIDGSDQQTIGNTGNTYPYRMDRDMTTGNLYYTSYPNTYIGVLTPSGENIRLLENFTNEQLGDIIVHPAKGWMYYTAFHVRSYIARANMDGTEEVKIIKGDNVTYPDGLAIDFNRNHLYWSDAAWDTIQRCNLEGKDCKTIVNKTGTYQPEEIRDLVTDGTFLYYSAYRKDHVVRVNLTEPYETSIVGQNPSLGKLDTIALYTTPNENMQPISEFCKDRDGLGDCSTICFPTHTSRTCACAAKIPLKSDGKTCSNIEQCSDVIRQEVQTKTSKEVIDIIVDKTCLRRVNDICSYSCPAFYAPVDKADQRLTCTNGTAGVRWANETESLCKELVCLDSSLPNGKVLGKCRHRTGDVCMFECDQGYTNTTDKISCNESLSWFPMDSCVAIVSVSQTQKGFPVAGVATGIVLFVIAIIVLVIVIVFLIRRKRARKTPASNYGNASFHQGQDGSIAIENPGYIPSEIPTTNKEEHPYETLDSSQVQPVFNERSTPAGQETLPEVASVEVTQDTAVLTYDSWLKERQKGAQSEK